MRTTEQSRTVPVVAPEARDLVRRVLIPRGVDAGAADRVASHLLTAERDGHPSHGLMRLLEYAHGIDAGELRPAAVPYAHRTAPGVSVVDGGQGLGVLALDAVAEELVRICVGHPVALVALRNAGHLGALAPLGRAVAASGLCCLGFVNYSGGGQRVAPPGAAEGRLATNPILAAFPATGDDDAPVVVDMTTAATSEGEIRARLLAEEPVPAGWLHDDRGRPTDRAQDLYENPPAAFIPPLGNAGAEHRGYALAVAVELLAGAVAGGGVARAGASSTGNAGLFLAFAPDVAGTSRDGYLSAFRQLENHLTTTLTQPGRPSVRLPGRGAGRATGGPVEVPARLWVQLRQLADASAHERSTAAAAEKRK
ncbi:Ldh family oxidoreductase [Streptomyces tibetensis]|uniref:Ldh family oxidoreductase n=1 Tax=Streptomyces tibetensis TaxID=2382123 RepID=UPI003407BDE7